MLCWCVVVCSSGCSWWIGCRGKGCGGWKLWVGWCGIELVMVNGWWCVVKFVCVLYYLEVV